jgi:hypothetical protein
MTEVILSDNCAQSCLGHPARTDLPASSCRPADAAIGGGARFMDASQESYASEQSSPVWTVWTVWNGTKPMIRARRIARSRQQVGVGAAVVGAVAPAGDESRQRRNPARARARAPA